MFIYVAAVTYLYFVARDGIQTCGWYLSTGTLESSWPGRSENFVLDECGGREN